MSEPADFDHVGLRAVLTCSGCPEQYDVYHGDRRVGYLRLRWGAFSARRTPSGQLDETSRYVYEYDFGDGWSGSFPNQNSRVRHLKRALKAIKDALNREASR